MNSKKQVAGKRSNDGILGLCCDETRNITGGGALQTFWTALRAHKPIFKHRALGAIRNLFVN